MAVSWHMIDLDARQVVHFDHSGVDLLALKSKVLLEMAGQWGYVTRPIMRHRILPGFLRHNNISINKLIPPRLL